MTTAPGARLRIALLAPPFVPIPPPAYGGVERVIAALADGLAARGHEVTLFASGDSTPPGELVPIVPDALWQHGFVDDPRGPLRSVMAAFAARAGDVDVVHSHLGVTGLDLAVGPTPLVSTFHLPVDAPDVRAALGGPRVGSLVAISRSQAALAPEAPWAAVVPNGLPLEQIAFSPAAGDGLCFVGRADPEKGILEAIEIARLTGRRLRIAAKVGNLPEQQHFFEEAFLPRLGRADVEFLGELGPDDRDRLVGESAATLMPVRWPEPFGLVAIESMAAGTPVLAYGVGALPEIVREGIDGYLGHDVEDLAARTEDAAQLDRAAIRSGVLERFSADRMVERYEALYERVAGGAAPVRRWADADSAGRMDPD